jgi:hypothetical protein
MVVRSSALQTLKEISDAAEAVVTVYATPAQQTARPYQIPIAIRNSLPAGVSFAKGCFLAELYPLVARKSRDPRSSLEVDQTIKQFCTALKSFEATLKSGAIVQSYNACVIHPKVRDDQLRSSSTDSSGALLRGLKQRLLYVQYALAAVALERIIALQRRCFVRVAGAGPGADRGAFEAAEAALRASVAADQQFAQLFPKFRELPPMAGTIETLEFCAERPEWQSAVGLAPGQVLKLKGVAAQIVDVVVAAEVGVRSFGRCGKCCAWALLRGMALCGKCERFVCCVRCSDGKCPECGEPITRSEV